MPEFLSIPREKFEEMLRLDVSAHVEKVQGYDYLQVHYARLLFKQNFPDLEVVVVPSRDGLPFHEPPENSAFTGAFFGIHLRDTVTGAVTTTEWHPAMRRPNKGEKKVGPALEEGTARELHDTLCRAIAKTIATYTGIGLNLWLQMPEFDEEYIPPKSDKKRKVVEEEEEEYYDDEEELNEADYDDEEEAEPVSRHKTTKRKSTSTQRTSTRAASAPTATRSSLPRRPR